ncbi:MAG: MFS transporter [Firmicutes bacterium]|nr:MFS transporter [Bacillota bacterium]
MEKSIELVQIQPNPASTGALIGGAIAAGHLLNDFMANILAPLLPFLSTHYGLSNTALGGIMAVFSASSAFTQPFFGMAVDHRRRGILLIWAAAWIGLAMSLLGIAGSLWALITLAFFGGLGSGLYHPLGATLMPKVVPARQQGLWMSIFFVAGNVGFSLTPLLIVPLVEAGGLVTTLWLLAPVLVVTLYMSLSGLGRVVDENPRATSRLESLAILRKNLGKVWVPVLAINLIVFLRTWVMQGLNTFLPAFLVQLGYPVVTAGQMVSVYLFFGAIAGFVGGYLHDKIGARKVIAGSLLLGTLLLFGFYRTAGPWKWIFLALAGAAVNCSLPVTVVVVQRLLPANAGLASGLMIGLVSACVSLFLPAIGAIADAWGVNTALYCFLPLLPTAALLTRLLPAHKPRQQ